MDGGGGADQTVHMSVMELEIAALARDSIERSRPLLDQGRVAYYVAHWAEAEPVVVFNVDGVLLLADGHHRVAAAMELGRTSVQAEVRTGERADALQFAIDHARKQRNLSRQEVLDAIARRGSPGAAGF
ncbi:MAG: ParB N-terminal domain-containing protein [Pseudarthrobacter sp.]|nr:ParB N-terminal domain-containing protein [Pseudarthrobacter sp.]NUS35076.1 ParB N-terminal domain-containing protein [Pseudarthrobacter sp.]